KNKIAFFKENILCEFWREELRLAKEMKQFSLFAFCLNYDHFHLLIKPKNKIANYSQIMHFIKRHTSRNINIILGYNKIDLEKMINPTENDIGIPSTENDVGISSPENDVQIPSTENDVGILSPEGDVGQRRLRGMKFSKFNLHHSPFVL
ncbi:MAG: transposase, partial [Candidatus Cloacimonadota bacterium]|nr:transposase [Candidatus Cloacimonadota bacterium]